MDCHKANKFLDVYVDGELDAQTMVEIENHVEACDACRSLVFLSKRLKFELTGLANVKAPDSLKAKVAGLSASRTRRRAVIWGTLTPVAAAAAVVLALNLGPLGGGESVELATVVEDVVEKHVGNLPMEVTESDPSEVAQWFDRKVDFPVRTPALRLKNASLEGGRISNVRDRQAAHINYLVDGHRVSLMIFNPRKARFQGGKMINSGGLPIWLGRRSGYNVAIVLDGDMAYALSSDLPQKRLVAIAKQLFR